MKVDTYLNKMVELTKREPELLLNDEIRFVMAQYAVDCIHDSELAQEAYKNLRDLNKGVQK